MLMMNNIQYMSDYRQTIHLFLYIYFLFCTFLPPKVYFNWKECPGFLWCRLYCVSLGQQATMNNSTHIRIYIS